MKGCVVEVHDRTSEAISRRRLEDMTDQIRQINARLLASALREHEASEKAEKAAKAKADFLAMMSHELRTPLTGIVGYTDLLQAEVAGPLNRRQRLDLDRIKICSNQLLELIDGVLMFSKAEVRSDDVLTERIDLAALAEEAAAVVEPVLNRKGLSLRVEGVETPVTAHTDPTKVRQILLNLLSNAAKFTERGEIRLELRVEGSDAVLSLRDSGIGIDPEDLERVFEPFVQTEVGLTRNYGGTGLGLAISRAFANKLGGTLAAQSSPGNGSTFTLRIPRGVSREAAAH